jgi:transposase
MADDLKSAGVTRVAMESTGVYWIPVWNILEERGFELMLVNPYLIKQMPGRKSDVKDAQWIALLLRKGMLRGSLVPNEHIRELRVYARKYRKLQGRTTSVVQEMDRLLVMCNIRIGSFVSDLTGKTFLRVVEAIANGTDSPDELLCFVHTRIINRHGTLLRDSLEGHICSHHRVALKMLMEEFLLLESQGGQCLELMAGICKEHYDNEMQLLKTHPGVSDIAAMTFIAESGADMSAFENSGKFSGWTGLRPRNDESAGKYKSTATTKGNKFIRVILVQIAWSAIRTKGSHYQGKFNRLAVRKSRKKALIAMARKIGTVLWNMLNDQKTYNPDLLPVYDSAKIEAKLAYHEKERQRLRALIQNEKAV